VLGRGRLDHVAEADAHVEDLVHLAVVDAGVALDEGKDGIRLDGPVNLVADGGGDAGEVEQAVAGDVYQPFWLALKLGSKGPPTPWKKMTGCAPPLLSAKRNTFARSHP
jgi:hypothetical protein